MYVSVYLAYHCCPASYNLLSTIQCLMHDPRVHVFSPACAQITSNNLLNTFMSHFLFKPHEQSQILLANFIEMSHLISFNSVMFSLIRVLLCVKVNKHITRRLKTS